MILISTDTLLDPTFAWHVTTTIFPDKTSQVWKLPPEMLGHLERSLVATIRWEFESESEFLHVAQLAMLVRLYTLHLHLDIPYLPFARQDKHVSNESTFALQTFAQLLNSLKFDEVRTLDVHSNRAKLFINNLVCFIPWASIYAAWDQSKATIALFPDAGAQARYMQGNFKKKSYALKEREPLLGHIKVQLAEPKKMKGQIVLLIDDICDGGMTFKLLAEQTLRAGAKEVHLYVTHGLFSKGLVTLRESGIKRIFTYKGEVEDYKIKGE